ncbi:hypothetical protein ACFSGX_14095 [Sphingomonas arantia]|uniref:Uncharacterized protein n=1 Tax=Sphingomonas arantia TaxID=1460676 RepID=A0ABW4U2D8_9SPHN
MSMLHAPAETPAARETPARTLSCPECMVSFAAVHPRQLFCSPAHRDRYHNRWTVRGRVLAPLEVADRITRGGTRGDVVTGRRARRDAQHLKDRWVVEDRDAKRMPAIEYVRLRLALGFEAA